MYVSEDGCCVILSVCYTGCVAIDGQEIKNALKHLRFVDENDFDAF